MKINMFTKKRKFRINLSLKVALATTGLLFVAGLIISGLSINYMEDNLKGHIREEQTYLAEHIASLLDHDLAENHKALIRKAANVTSDMLADRHKMQTYMDQSAALLTLFDNGVYVFLPDGTLYAESPRHGKPTFRNEASQAYFRDTIMSNGPVISAPYVSSTKHSHGAIMLTAPIFDSHGRIIAVYAGSIDLTETAFFSKFSDLKLPHKSFITIVSGEGVCIVHPDKSQGMVKLSPAVAEEIRSTAFTDWPTTVERKSNRGVDIISTSKRLRSANWIVNVNVDKDAAYAPIRETALTYIKVLLLGLPFAILVIFLISRAITQPLRSITRQIKALQESPDLKSRVSVQSRDEMRDLAGAVNNMLDTIVASHDLIVEKDKVYETWFDKSKDAIVLLDSGWQVTDMNSIGYSIFNVPRTVQFSLWDMLGHDGEEALKQVMKATGYLKDIELNVKLKSGQDGIVLFSCEAVKEHGGVPAAYMGILRDITEYMESVKALEQSEENYRSLFLESKDAIFVSTPAGKYLDINPAGVAHLGYDSKEELMALDINKDVYVNPEDRMKFRAGLDTVGYVKDHEVKMKGKDGRILTVLSTATAVKDKTGNVVAYRGIRRDITGYKRLEQQLMQAQKMEAVGHLAGGVAHDFNNLLTVIAGYGALLQRHIGKDEVAGDYIGLILDAAKKAADVTKNLLAFSKEEMINAQPTDLNEVVLNLRKLLERLIGEDIEIVTSLFPGDITGMADGGQIGQVLMNLATNARDAMPGGGTLTISTEIVELDDAFVKMYGFGSVGEYGLISVADNGLGMPASILKKIFDPFFTTKETGKGTGLGLAMAYGIVTQHNGFINAYSEIGEGTTFKIYLPLTALNKACAKARQEQPLDNGSETILVTEDDDKLRKLYDVVLTQNGYKVILAQDGESAINRFIENRERINLVMLDMLMPKMNGQEAAAQIVKLDPEMKVLFLSGYTADRIKLKDIREGNVNFISKPVSPKDLLIKVREILDAGACITGKSVVAEDRKSICISYPN